MKLIDDIGRAYKFISLYFVGAIFAINAAGPELLAELRTIWPDAPGRVIFYASAVLAVCAFIGRLIKQPVTLPEPAAPASKESSS